MLHNGYLTAFMVLVGTLLLLPGLCSMAVGAFTIYAFEPRLILVHSCTLAIGLLVGIGGVMLIRAAIRRRRAW